MQCAVIGLGKSGEAALWLLVKQGWSVALWDGQDTPALRERAELLADHGVTVHLGQRFIPDPALQKIIISPGVPWDAPFLIQARQMGITVQGEVDLAWESLSQIPWIAITGTNGKTTTTALLHWIWKLAGYQAPACGNIGLPIAQVALDPHPDWVIAELSSFQIEQSPQVAPKLALWTTFSPDHLNRHGTKEYYAQIKSSLLDRADTVVLNGDDPYLRTRIYDWPQVLWTSSQDPLAPVRVQAGWIYSHETPILAIETIPLPGVHNLHNVLMAVATAHHCGIAPEIIAQAVQSFPGVPHRLESVGVWKGVLMINDSKATNYEAAQVGLCAMPDPVILIAGGRAKEGDPQDWLTQIRQKALGVVLYGEAGPYFADLLRQAGYDTFECCVTLDEAVPLAWQWALAKGISSVLLSPACASYDQFANFEERGSRFRKLCYALGT